MARSASGNRSRQCRGRLSWRQRNRAVAAKLVIASPAAQRARASHSVVENRQLRICPSAVRRNDCSRRRRAAHRVDEADPPTAVGKSKSTAGWLGSFASSGTSGPKAFRSFAESSPVSTSRRCQLPSASSGMNSMKRSSKSCCGQTAPAAHSSSVSPRIATALRRIFRNRPAGGEDAVEHFRAGPPRDRSKRLSLSVSRLMFSRSRPAA